MSASKVNFEIRTEMSLRRFEMGPGYFSANIVIFKTVSMTTWPDSYLKVSEMHHKLKREVQEAVDPIYRKYKEVHIPLPLVLSQILVIPGVTEVQEVGEYGMRVFRDKDEVNIPKKK